MKTQQLADLVAVTIKKELELGKITKPQSKAIVQSVFDTIQDALRNGENVEIFGFGNFEIRERASRPGVNPQTGEKITIAATKTPGFKPSKATREAVKGLPRTEK